MNNFSNIIAKALHIGEPYVLNTLALIDEGATIPFISRYRKEKTGGMDEVQIGQIDELYSRLKELAKRWKPEAVTSFKKSTQHQALSDIQESIDELIHYRRTIMTI